MNTLTKLLGQKRLVMATVLLLAIVGISSWFGMNRQEDPAFPYRYGFVTVAYPGADVDQIERLITQPLEEELAQVEYVDELRSTIRAGFALVVVVMQQTVYDTDTAWDRVRIAVQRAQTRFPEGAQSPQVDDRIIDAATVVLAVTGSNDQIAMQDAAEKIRDRMLSVNGVARVRLFGHAQEQITIAYDDAQAQSLGLSPGALAAQLQGRNQVVPGGYLNTAGRQLQIRPQTDFADLQSLQSTPIAVPNGTTLPLSSIADVRMTPREPATETAWVDNQRAMVIGIIGQNDSLNAEFFGEQIRERVESLRPQFAPLDITELFFQPDRVHERLSELGGNLLAGVLIVASILFLVMGLRMGLLVALMVPLVTLTSLAMYNIGGGVLHQMAVAGMVIALGMLVDNAIVMAENIQWHIDRKLPKPQAARRSVRELAGPLGAATGTTVAVFIPMVLARGDTADFTRAVPSMIILMLLVSYVYAVMVTPIMAGWFLNQPKAQMSLPQRANEWLSRRARAVGRLAVDHSVVVLIGAVVFLSVCVVLSGGISRNFFPDTDRNQFIVDVYYPEGTPIVETTNFALQLSHELRQQPGVQRTYTFTGNSGPKFYYNLNETPRSPYLGRVVVLADDVSDIRPLSDWVREQNHTRWPQVQLVPRRLEQGPPTPAPIEVRMLADDWNTLGEGIEQVTRTLRDIQGTVDVRHDMGIGVPTLKINVDDQRSQPAGVTRELVGQSLARQSQGLQIGSFRAERDPMPIVLRSGKGEYFPADQIAAVQTWSSDNQTTMPILGLSDPQLTWQPSVRHHFNLQPSATVFSELMEGVTYAGVYAELERRLEESALPAGVKISAGGAQRSSGQANSALFSTLPLGLILLLFFLLLQFNSFRKVGLVLVTVPLALAGVVPGLLLTGYPFGFMALLGVIALIGIVVNNAIVLLDVVDQHLQEGENLRHAIIEAVTRRTRPVLLTTATTVAGLLPLTATQSTLWPPMAWTIISGLIVSTLFTLGVIPALARWVLR